MLSIPRWVYIQHIWANICKLIFFPLTEKGMEEQRKKKEEMEKEVRAPVNILSLFYSNLYNFHIQFYICSIYVRFFPCHFFVAQRVNRNYNCSVNFHNRFSLTETNNSISVFIPFCLIWASSSCSKWLSLSLSLSLSHSLSIYIYIYICIYIYIYTLV